jgi:hypothetical protein
MDCKTLENMRRTVEKADKIQSSIREINKALKTISEIGADVSEIHVDYWGKVEQEMFGSEIGDTVRVTLAVTPKLLEVDDQKFDEYFRGMIIATLNKMKKDLEDEYKSLK